MRTTNPGVLILATALAAVGCKGVERAYHDVRGDRTTQQQQQQRVDLNTATVKELSRLPGLTDDDAQRIIANRPYGSKQGLLRKNVIGEKKYEQIQDYVYASQSR